MKKKQTKVEKVYDYILSELVQQHFVAGDRLVISQIANSCNSSEIPVREALRLLESDGYIKINANHGATVVGFSKEMLRNISEVKGILEGYATRVSLDYLSPNDLRTLHNINEQMHTAAQNGDDAQYSEMNIRFHTYIYEKVPNKELQELIQKIWQKWRFTAQVFSVTPQRMSNSYQEHKIILNLLEQKKYDEVEQFVRCHRINALSEWGDELSTKSVE